MPTQSISFTRNHVGLVSVWLILVISLIFTPSIQAVTKVGNVKITATLPAYNTANETYESYLTVTNTSAKKPIHGPLAVKIPATLKKNITLVEPYSISKNQGMIPISLPSGVLAPQQTLANIVVAYHNPDGKKFTFAKQVVTALPDLQPVKPNHIPVANITQDQLVTTDSLIELIGSASSDPEGQSLTYKWTLLEKPEGSTAELSNTDQPHAWLGIDQPGRYKIKLVVNDGQINSFPDILVLETDNTAPVADAGPAIKALKGSLITLSGVNSFDREWANLSYQWSLPIKPGGSKARLIPSDQADVSFKVDKKGSYTARLVVNDGQQNSLPATVTVSTQNNLPVANAGSDVSEHLINQLLTLSGTLSSDADNNDLSYRWSLLYKPTGSQSQLSVVDQMETQLTPDSSGYYIAQLIVNDGLRNSDPDTVEIHTVSASPDNHPPVISSEPLRLSLLAGQSFAYSVTATDADSDSINYALLKAAPGMSINPLSGDINWTASSSLTGNIDISIKVSDGRGGSDTQTFTLAVSSNQLLVPELAGKSLSQALALLNNSGLAQGTLSYAHHDNTPSGYVISQSATAGALVEASNAINLQISTGPNGSQLPPEPANIAPAINATTSSTVDQTAAFLYSGAQPVQTGMSADTIAAQRAAVIRGKVLDGQNQPLSGVTVSLLNHAEYGQTISRSNGEFDLVVNGGGSLTLNYSKAGLLTAQRQLDVPWQDYTLAPDVVMKALDNQVTTIQANAASLQVARGSTQTDRDGSRQATLFFPAGTTASLKLPDGSSQTLSTFHVRATEYTVGDNGPAAMPGELPPTSGYTYAVEYSVDEAQAVGATEVTFNQPVISYNENFLDFPVGTTVPAGFYDRQKGIWVTQPNGRVIKIAAINNGKADLIIAGSGATATEQDLTSLGITEAERQQLAALYPAGQSLWRVPMDHLTPWDLNWSRRTPPNANPPNEPPPSGGGGGANPNDPCQKAGCIIGIEGQTLDEELDLTGTPYALRYSSDRQQGRIASKTLTIPLIGDQISPSLKRIELNVRIAGQLHSSSFPAQANQSTTFTWDGKDVYGRSLEGGQPAFIDLGYVYNATYEQTAAFGESGSGVQISGDETRNEVTLHQTHSVTLGEYDARKQALGGWTFNVHHVYDPLGRVLYQGDGQRRSVEGLSNIMTTAINPQPGNFSGLGSLTVGPDGSFYFAIRSQIHKIDPAGNRTVIAGTGVNGFSGDGGLAINAQISFCAYDLGLTSDGSLIFSEGNCNSNRIRRIGTDGIITTIAGSGPPNGSSVTIPPEGILATDYPFVEPKVSPAPDGTVYIADNSRLFRLGTDGRLRVVSIDYSAPDAGPNDRNFGIADFTVGKDGTIYLTDTHLVLGNFLLRKIDPDGKIHVIAGTNQGGSSGDGGPALAATIFPSINGGIAVSPSGDVYFTEGDSVIRKISSDGIITQFAGNRSNDYTGDGGPATQASIASAPALSFGPDGALYMADNHVIRRVGPPLPGYDASSLNIPSEDGSELFVFDASGKHLRTVNTLTGATVLSFAYDSAGRLISVTDGDNNVTTIERDSFGNPTGIVSPYNQRTQLNVNGNGYVSSIVNPANETERFTYSSTGLLLSKKDSGNHLTTFVYDESGRLISDKDALNNLQVLTKTGTDQDYTVQHQSPLGRKSEYEVQMATDGSLRRIVTATDGTTSQFTKGANGINQTSNPDGTTRSETLTGDPRWNMQAPYAKSATLNSGGLTATVSNNIVASLSDPANLLSLTALTETSTLNNRSYTSQYLASNKTLTETSPLGRIAKTQIDNLGRPVLMQVSGLFDTQANYDTRGRLSSISSGADSEQRTTTITYNTAGYVSEITDALGRVEAFAYDAAGRVTQQILTDGREIAYSYDSRGNLTGLTPPGRAKHSFSYDALNQNDSYVPPTVSNGGGTQYVYDKDRQLSQIIRPDNQTLSLVYDTAGRLDTLKTPLGDYGYDYQLTTGQLTQLTSPTAGKLDFSYNGALLTGVTFSGEVAGSVGYGYDNDFRVNEISVNAANPVSYGYDNDSLLTQVGDLQFSRNSQNGLPTGSALGVVTDSRTFNGFAETSQYQANINSDNAYKAEYSYDKLGRISQKIETLLDAAPVTYVYSYDTAGRLSQVKKGSEQTTYGYDSNGNRITVNGATVGSYDDQDRLTNYNGTTYAYTANGELQSKSTGGNTTQYQYDVLGNLRQVSFANGDKIEYSIDASNRRVGRKAVIGGVTTEQRFLYQDDLKIIAELDANNTVISRFVYGSRVNVPDYMIRDGNTYRLIADHLGSPRIIINTATGAIAQRMDYDAWGKVLSDSNPGFQPFGFAGGLYDKQTGLVRFGVRDYEVDTGRWTTKDPIDFAGKSTNLYEYVNNDPQNNIDFEGYESFKDKIVDWAKGKAIDWATDSIVDPLDKLGKWMDHGRENPLRKKYLKKFLDIRSAKDLGNMICDLKNLIDEQTERQKQADEEHLKRLEEKLKKVYEANKASDRLRYQRQGLPYPNK